MLNTNEILFCKQGHTLNCNVASNSWKIWFSYSAAGGNLKSEMAYECQ